ncbi:hypothetical protein F5876DRAFT_84217 [Lentinula aff. lateritia]|uniref:Uncharacterized protein n=1 Tax=Lentinula aff. lateritia TaxID=2804960 RepID=A0ACC1TH21_9AGAR|nr:hypothetical protein F5876DRAFT_84217 [Lentinula aff. lateritia]
MRSHRTLIPFIALAVTLAANAAPVLHPLGARESDTNVLHTQRASPTPDVLEAHADVDFNVDSQLRSRTVEPRAKKKNKKKNQQRKQQKKQQQQKANAGGGQTDTTSDGQGVPVPEGNKEAAPNGGKVEAAQVLPKKPQPASEANGDTHAGTSNSGVSNMKGNENENEPSSAAITASSNHEPKPGGLSRVNTGSSISSTSSHSSTSSQSSCSSHSSSSSQSSVDPYDHDHMYGTHCDPVPHQPAEEPGESKEEEDKEKKKEDEAKEKKKGKQTMRNVVGGVSAAAGFGLLGAGIWGMTKLADSSKSAFESVGNEGESASSESSSLNGIQFGSKKRDIGP